MDKKCEVCKREIGKTIYMIFVSESETLIGIPTGFNLYLCQECGLSAYSQLYKLSNEELQESIDD